MALLLLSLLVLTGSGALALCLGRLPRLATLAGAGGAVAGSAVGFVPALETLLSGESESIRWSWSVPYGSFLVEVDPLSAFFLLVVLGLSAVAAVYGAEYLFPHRRQRSLGPPWFFYNLLVASMALVVLARNGVLFLVAWELMAIASYFLVTFEDDKESVREAGWTYLVATHLGTAFLLVAFILLGKDARSLDFDRFAPPGGAAPASAGGIFLLLVAGFGAKAGLMPFHVWLPEAHPAAPSHVSAVMSGVMIKTGIYGLLRFLGFLGAPAEWWGWTLLALGVISGVLGVLLALSQSDLKRLLAYSSVENIGIIALGIGTGLLGQFHGSPTLAVLGFGGALFHVLHHALFKGLLFLAAGSLLHATGGRSIEGLGGLLKRMRWTGLGFLAGSVAISGLPPLNAFASEFLLYFAAFGALTALPAPAAVPQLLVIAALALIGGLAAACFARAFGAIFLGAPRSANTARAHDPGAAMRLAMGFLALGCLVAGLASPFVVKALAPAAAAVSGLDPSLVLNELGAASYALLVAVAVSAGFAAILALLVLVRRSLLAGREVGVTVTWDCGYAAPSPRMQYTASSFAQPFTHLFGLALRARRRLARPGGYFPSSGSFATETPDTWREAIYSPLFRAVAWALSRLRWLQHGRVQLYILYIAVTLLVLLVWKLD